MAKKLCFVVCPIGAPGSEVQHDADELLELVLEPALEKYNFDVMRADSVPRATLITAEMVALVQEAHLCIIDLTGHDPTVFYECGRRHETGKPFIQLVRKTRKEEPLPFDVAGIRTIEYDCSTPYSTLASIKTLQGFIDEFERSGYATTSSGISLTTIAAAVDRIDREIAKLPISGYVPWNRAPSPSNIMDAFKPPRDIFWDAASTGDVQRAAEVLPRLREIQDFIPAATLIAKAGIQVGCDELQIYIERRGDQIDPEDFEFALGSIVEFHLATESERDGLPTVERLVNEYLAKRTTVDPEHEAFIRNQLQRMKYATEDYQGALEVALKVLDLMPDDPAYLYNASTIYEKLNDVRQAESFVDRYMSAGIENSPDQLSHAVELYVMVGRVDDARLAFERLLERDRGKATLLLLNSKVAHALQR
jgi:tetratricopeptide (TPR) repeat protein